MGGPEVSARRKNAKDLVAEIQRSHGYISQSRLMEIEDLDLRAEVIGALQNKDGMISSSVITLAKNLYTSSARFVFELLQNADDNKYSKTTEKPFITFRVYPHKIIAEYNEDGFSPENLAAICKVGQSTKTGAQGYIGAKGIGFKSVFMVAWKVSIQSGDFSFCFEHRKGDSGMGMISPIWQEHDDSLPDLLTRVTLLLHDSDDQAAVAAQRESIRSQFRELRVTFLLFLKNIKKINLIFYDQQDKIVEEIYHSIETSPQGTITTLEKETRMNSSTENVSQMYYVSRSTATGLRKHENREYTEEEEKQKQYAQSEIVLAFPLAPDSSALIQAQDVFAFLPLRSAGFSFLIQADFVTEANRQDIVEDSLRNQGLSDRIAHAFIKAVLELCKHETLAYQWMKYLPDPSNTVFSSFWKRFISTIQTSLETTPVLYCRSGGPLRSISSLNFYVNHCRDDDDNPLWDDIDPPCYLSTRYNDKHLQVLRPYGLSNMGIDQLIARATADLESPNSRTKAMKDENWHSHAAQLLTLPFTKGWTSSNDVKKLNLIPLQTGQWISAERGDIYYASIAGITIPKDLDLNLIDPIAAANSHRKTLFDHLGAKEASISMIQEVILKLYTTSKNDPKIDIRTSKEHLRFLYRTSPQKNNTLWKSYDDVYFHSEEGTILYPRRSDVYAPSDAWYSAKQLLKPTPPGSQPGDGAPGFAVPFPHESYFKDVPEKPESSSNDWKTFLHKNFRIRETPRLVQPISQNEITLSPITRYLQRHRPEILLHVIYYYEYVEAEAILKDCPANSEMRAMDVLCRGGRKMPLSDTFLPNSSLERLQARYMEDSESFPFLKLPFEPKDDPEKDGWHFLHTNFGVGRSENLDFYLAIITSILDANTSAETVRNISRIFGLYGRIQVSILASEAQDEVKVKVRKLFDSQPAILIPGSRFRSQTWASSTQCVWEGVDYMQNKYPVKSLLQPYFPASESEASCLKQFFKTTLLLPDCSWDHILDELKYLKSNSCTDFDKIRRFYEVINTSIDKDNIDHLTTLRQEFEDNALIYVSKGEHHGWYRTSQCLWASVTSIRGRVTLNDHYEDSKDFFVSILGVSELNLNMVMDELVEKGASQASLEEIKETLWALTSFLSSTTTKLSPKKILGSRIFPVKYPNGQVVLRTSEVQFGIVDRRLLGNYFTGKANLLEFSLDEVLELKPFFSWTGLESRYLSHLVKEISRADGGEPVLISNPTRGIAHKTPWLLQIAKHYGSPRITDSYSSLKSLLEGALIYETDGICSSLLLSQGGSEIVVEMERSDLHIHDDGQQLQIYIPRNARSQEYCLMSRLPPRLFEWIMTHPITQIREHIPSEAVLVVTRVLNSSMSTANWILEGAGIAEVNDIGDIEAAQEVPGSTEQGDRNTATEEVQSGNTQVSTNREALITSSTTRNTSVAPVSSPAAPSHTFDGFSQASTLNEDIHASSRFRSTPISPQPVSIQRLRPETSLAAYNAFSSADDVDLGGIQSPVDEDISYVALLQNIINKSGTSPLSNLDSFDMSQLLQALPDSENSSNQYSHDTHQFRTATQRERDNKIGAAGELFVFELLSRLNPTLPGFSEDNWQSTIRKYVKVHPNYAHLEAWEGRETADIVYKDHGSVLTDLLVEKNYLDAEKWRGRQPTFYIEVKSTTGPCGMRFFMSKYQYARMQNYSLECQDHLSPDANIYVVFRIFNIGSGQPGVQIYMDPEHLRQTGSLIFTGETWSIVPSSTRVS